jgi:hypothetical protein
MYICLFECLDTGTAQTCVCGDLGMFEEDSFGEIGDRESVEVMHGYCVARSRNKKLAHASSCSRQDNQQIRNECLCKREQLPRYTPDTSKTKRMLFQNRGGSSTPANSDTQQTAHMAVRRARTCGHMAAWCTTRGRQGHTCRNRSRSASTPRTCLSGLPPASPTHSSHHLTIILMAFGFSL